MNNSETFYVVPDTPTKKLFTQSNDLIKAIVDETDTAKLEDLTNLFSINQRKKDLVRLNRLSGLIDLVDDEVISRFSAYPDTFDNDQLLNYMSRTQQMVSSIEQNINNTPTIQINNQTNTVNISNESGLDRESRQRVLDAVNKILNNSLQNDNNSDIIDVEVDN